METFTPGLSFGLVDGRPVFMDAGEDSYFLLEAEQEEEFLELLKPQTQHRRVSAGLRAALSLPAEPKTLTPVQCPAPKQSLLDVGVRKVRLTDVVKLWRILHRVRRSLKQRPIESLLDELRAIEPTDSDRPSADQLTAGAIAFAAARKAVPISPNCLSDSLALLVWLGPAPSAATLVFGVKLDPFAAHCWVQAGAMLLNDRVDEIARFQAVRMVACSPATR